MERKMIMKYNDNIFNNKNFTLYFFLFNSKKKESLKSRK